MNKKQPNTLTFNRDGYYWTFIRRRFMLNQKYLYCKKVVRLIKVSPKGFNFLIEDTGRCLFQRSLFCRDWSNRKIPKSVTEFRLYIPECMKLEAIDG